MAPIKDRKYPHLNLFLSLSLPLYISWYNDNIIPSSLLDRINGSLDVGGFGRRYGWLLSGVVLMAAEGLDLVVCVAIDFETFFFENLGSRPVVRYLDKVSTSKTELVL